MSAQTQRFPERRQFLVGPSRDGLWVVRDADGVAGAVFIEREQALHFVKSECEALLPIPAAWIFVPALDLGALFAPPPRDSR